MPFCAGDEAGPLAVRHRLPERDDDIGLRRPIGDQAAGGFIGQRPNARRCWRVPSTSMTGLSPAARCVTAPTKATTVL